MSSHRPDLPRSLPFMRTREIAPLVAPLRGRCRGGAGSLDKPDCRRHPVVLALAGWGCQHGRVTKADIVERVCDRVGGFSKKEAADIVDEVFDAMKTAVEEGDKIKISGFGNFIVREKKPRPGRNPQTGQEIMIEARRVLTFKPSNVLKAALNDED